MPTPTLIIHGGAGAITRENLSPKAWAQYSANLSRIYRSTAALLDNGASALDASTHAVTLFEDCELFNCGKGAIFTRDGTIELEASVMVTHPYQKRYCAAVLLSHVKNPIKFVREMLIRGEHDGSGGGNSGGDGDPAGGSGGAQGHCCLSGDGAEKLAKRWGLEMVEPRYFWTRKRWEEHRKGLGKPTKVLSKADTTQSFCGSCARDSSAMDDRDPNHHHQTEASRNHKYPLGSSGDPPDNSHYDNDDDIGEGWDGIEYLPQGTVGCIALDRNGALCVATSTGGLTNKLAGRIGDTPTVGAGFWAEEWESSPPPPLTNSLQEENIVLPPIIKNLVTSIRRSVPLLLGDCIPTEKPSERYYHPHNLEEKKPATQIKAVALSGTGNGDSFLRLSACRTAGAIVRFSPPPPDGLVPVRTLASAVNQIAGLGGELQRSAGERWGESGEGEGGMIGIEYWGDSGGGRRGGGDGGGDGKGKVVFDFNCGGMFRCWVDAGGRERVMVFRDEY